ncbi:hypothetical protein [Methanolapillus ohkumae]
MGTGDETDGFGIDFLTGGFGMDVFDDDEIDDETDDETDDDVFGTDDLD